MISIYTRRICVGHSERSACKHRPTKLLFQTAPLPSYIPHQERTALPPSTDPHPPSLVKTHVQPSSADTIKTVLQASQSLQRQAKTTRTHHARSFEGVGGTNPAMAPHGTQKKVHQINTPPLHPAPQDKKGSIAEEAIDHHRTITPAGENLPRPRGNEGMVEKRDFGQETKNLMFFVSPSSPLPR